MKYPNYITYHLSLFIYVNRHLFITQCHTSHIYSPEHYEGCVFGHDIDILLYPVHIMKIPEQGNFFYDFFEGYLYSIFRKFPQVSPMPDKNLNDDLMNKAAAEYSAVLNNEINDAGKEAEALEVWIPDRVTGFLRNILPECALTSISLRVSWFSLS